MVLPQADLGLLQSDVAQRLLASSVPAPLAYMSTDGTPRGVPIWFHYEGGAMNLPEIVPEQEWQRAHEELLAKEKAHMREGDRLAAERRRQPTDCGTMASRR
jgi:hypothetical protein